MKKTRKVPTTPGGRSAIRVRAADACPVCGAAMSERRGRLRLPVNGEEIPVPGALHLRCPDCGEVVLRLTDARRLAEDAAELYRRKHGLLSADEIRAMRETLSLTQAELARLLRLGANTVSRWESGRNVQAAALDVLLRLLRDVPGNLDYVRRNVA